MDLGFLPENMQSFAISRSAGFYGPKGNQNEPLGGGTARPRRKSTANRSVTFDASKAGVCSQFVTTWVAYGSWENKFGLDHNAAPGVCTIAGQSTNSCVEWTVYAGVTAVKF